MALAAVAAGLTRCKQVDTTVGDTRTSTALAIAVVVASSADGKFDRTLSIPTHVTSALTAGTTSSTDRSLIGAFSVPAHAAMALTVLVAGTTNWLEDRTLLRKARAKPCRAVTVGIACTTNGDLV